MKRGRQGKDAMQNIHSICRTTWQFPQSLPMSTMANTHTGASGSTTFIERSAHFKPRFLAARGKVSLRQARPAQGLVYGAHGPVHRIRRTPWCPGALQIGGLSRPWPELEEDRDVHFHRRVCVKPRIWENPIEQTFSPGQCRVPGPVPPPRLVWLRADAGALEKRCSMRHQLRVGFWRNTQRGEGLGQARSGAHSLWAFPLPGASFPWASTLRCASSTRTRGLSSAAAGC